MFFLYNKDKNTLDIFFGLKTKKLRRQLRL